MLSAEAVGDASQAKHYFLEQDNYYIEDREAKERSEWWGKGARALELSGEVDAEVFTALLKGQLPHGQQLGIKLEGDIKHRPGFDLTFSVPKSVSLLALMGDDKRILGAVQQAVDKALEQIEQGCAQARVTKEGVTAYQNTQNLVVAKFLHDISREGDPQLHVHCVAMNMTQRNDSQWRSLASQSGDYGAKVTGEVNGFLERVRHHKHYYGLLFRAELAHELKQLGYTLVKTGKGLFEVEGISQKVLGAYSQRSQQIEAYMREHGYSGGKAAAVATLKTRKAKNINRETLRELWQARGDVYQVDAFCETKQVVERALNQDKTSPHSPNVDLAAAREAVKSAIHQLSETQVAIQQIQLINTALYYAMDDNVNTQAILQAIHKSQAKGELIPLNVTHPSSGLCFTTQQLLHYEHQIVTAMTQKHPSEQPLLSEHKVNAYLAAQADLNSEQQQAIKILFSSNHQVMALEGPTGSGKTTLLKPLVALAKLGGYHAVVLTPDKASQVQVKQQNQPSPQSFLGWLKQHLDYTQYETVPHFLNVQEKWLDAGRHVLPNSVIFVDQATLVSSKQMHDLVQITRQTGARLIALGDAKSLLPWQSGAPFIQMLHQGITRASLTKNCRQQHEALKTAIADTLQGNIAAAFEKIGHRILSIENKEERLERMADHFASLDEDQQKKARVLMPTQRQCEEMNTAIRNRLKQQNVVSKVGIEMMVWLPKHFSETQYRIAKSYDVGQWVRFNAPFKSLGVKRGDYCEIKAIQHTHNLIVLENAQGKHITWNPTNIAGRSGAIEVFETKSREVAIGDILLWKRNDTRKTINKGERLQVAEIQDHRLRLTCENSKSIRINVKEIQACHFDYGYASTPYQTPSDSNPILIAYQNSFSRQSHQRLFYKLISQATQQAWIYTEDRNRLLSNLQSQTGNKVTALGMLLGDQPLPRDASEQNMLLEKAVNHALETLQKSSDPEKTSDSVAQDAVRYALAHLTEREAAFTHKEVLQVALEHALGEVAIPKIQQAILDAEKNGDLIRGLYSQNGTHWTTREALEMEREIIQLARQSQGQLDPIASLDMIDVHLQKTQPKSEHAHAVREMAGAMDQVVLMQGYAGTGKTTLLKNVKILLHQQNQLNQCEYDLLCLAPTHPTVKELKERGLTAQTLDSYLAHCRSFQASNVSIPQYHYQRVIAVDESSMLSNRRLRDFLLFTQLTQIRVFLMGDREQYSAIESGKPFSLLQHNGLKVIRLTDIERQKDDTLKKAVKEVYSGQFAAAFHTLADHMIEIGQEKVGNKYIDNRPKRLEAIAEDYLSRTSLERAQTLLITLGNEDRALLNALIRERLQGEGELHGKRVVTTILVSRDMTHVERAHVANYRPTDIIRFNYTDPLCGIEKNEYLTLLEVKQNYLVLQKDNGQSIVWQPRQWTSQASIGVEVYEPQTRELQAGDLIRWTRSDKTVGLLSPELAKIESVETDHCQLRLVKITSGGISPDGDLITVDHQDKKYQHWDHAYAMTGYSAQGKTIQSVILNAESYRKNLVSQPSFIVGLTRAVQHITIYTDDKEALLSRILKNKGEKSSALEIVGECKAHADPKHAFLSKSSSPNQEQISIAPRLSQPLLDVHRLTQMLHDKAEQVLKHILGEPKEKSNSQYRYGSKKGSLVVTLQGDKRGLWHDFQTGEGGNLLHLVAKQSGLDMKGDFRKVLTQAIHLLGTSEATVSSKIVSKKAHANTKLKGLTEEQKHSLNYARQLAHESQPISGTLAERYLREHRGIALEKWPESFRFHPAIYSRANDAIKPALLVVAKDEGKTQAVQAIFLDETTATKADVNVQKQTWGILSAGASVEVSHAQIQTSPLYLAEGPETGLSIHASMPHAHVKVTLSTSNFKNINPKTVNQPIVLCLDNDGNNPQTQKLIHFVAERLLAEGKQVWIAKPAEVGKDYNDLLKNKGIDAVRTHVEQAIPYDNYRDQRATTKTLKSEIVTQLNELGLSDPAIAARFIRQEKEAIKLSELDAEKLTCPTRKIERILTERASEFITMAGSVSQQDINRYLSTLVDNARLINHGLSQLRAASQPPIVENVKDKIVDF